MTRPNSKTPVRDGIRDESLGFALEKERTKKPVSGIDIRSLCKKAGVGRTTFYRYYGEKSGLTRLFMRGEERQFGEYLKEHPVNGKENRDQRLLSFLYSKKELLLALNSFGEDGLLLYLLKALVPVRKQDVYSYLDPMGIGLRYGLLKAWLDPKMDDSVGEVQKKSCPPCSL